MTISRKVWQRYIQGLRQVSDEAARLADQYLTTHDVLTPAGTDALIDYCYGLATKYGEAAAELAAQMYDALAAATGAAVAPAAPAAPATPGEVAKAVVGTRKTGNNDIVSDAIGRLVKMSGVDTMMQNALRDGAEWAWIPTGETCAYCIALASNGWQRASKKAIKGGHAEHIHANCDCTYAIRFDGVSDVEGFDDGKAYAALYDDADLDHWNTPDGKPPAGRSSEKQTDSTKRINALRREIYAKKSAEINASKRSAYAKRVERERSAAEELDVNP